VGSWHSLMLIQKKAIFLIPSLPHSMRNFIPFVAEHSAIANSEGEK